MSLPFTPAFPWLLYAYPWMPYPRRVIIYLREKGISESLVKVAHVSDPQAGNEVIDSKLPPKPAGSLPILAMPSQAKGSNGETSEWIYMRQSMAIINFLRDMCNAGEYTFSAAHGSLLGNDPLLRARTADILALAEDCTIAWWIAVHPSHACSMADPSPGIPSVPSAQMQAP